MKLEKTFIDGVYLLRREPQGDNRGFLERLFCKATLNNIFNQRSLRQINHTYTRESGVVRGMHFQYPPHAETKVVSCIKGSVFDVVVDLRKGSPTFLRYYANIISDENFCSIIVPEGVAHGFQTLTHDCEMLYLHTADYNYESEGAINSLDPILDIKWPNRITQRSERDASHPMLSQTFLGVELS
jgi:dTDP-4-dehydrorhamnose 3,5-epimerase